MDWMMVVIIGGCNVITVLICRYAYQINDQYKNGMLLGVHIPAWAVHQEKVQKICAKSSRLWNRYHWCNLFLSIAVCLLSVLSTEIAVIMWLIWITGYIIGCWLLLVKIYRDMYRLKIENNWYDEQTRRIRISKEKKTGQQVTETVDDDVYWLNGWYSNPRDKRTLVESKFCNVNMEFNMAKPGVKVLVSVLLAVTIGIIIWCISMMIPLIHMETDLQIKEDQIQVKGGGYDVEFAVEEIEKVELLSEFPNERFRRKNGGNTKEYLVGRFSDEDKRRVMLFLYKERTPVLKIELEDETIYLNSEDEEETVGWYEMVK